MGISFGYYNTRYQYTLVHEFGVLEASKSTMSLSDRTRDWCGRFLLLVSFRLSFGISPK